MFGCKITFVVSYCYCVQLLMNKKFRKKILRIEIFMYCWHFKKKYFTPVYGKRVAKVLFNVFERKQECNLTNESISSSIYAPLLLLLLLLTLKIQQSIGTFLNCHFKGRLWNPANKFYN